MAKTRTKTKAKAETKQTRDVVVREEIKKLDQTVESSHIELAKLLHEAYHNQFYLNWGFNDDKDGFAAWAEADLSMNYRKVMYLITIWDKVHDLGLDVATVEAIGWSKMKEIVPLVETKKDANVWMKRADKMSFRDLLVEVKKEREKQGTSRGSSLTKFTFSASDDEAKSILDALEQSKRVLETTNDTTALEYICQEWLATVGATPEHMTLDTMVSFIEKTFEVTVNVEGGAEVASEETEEKPKDKKKAKAALKTKKKGKAKAKPEPEEAASGPV